MLPELVVPFRFDFFRFFNRFFYYPIWIAMDVSTDFFKVFNLSFPVLVIGTNFQGP